MTKICKALAVSATIAMMPGLAAAQERDVAAAEAFIAPYVGQPSPFPVNTPLNDSPAGKRIAYIDCGTPVCALTADLLQPAIDMLDMEMTRIQTGFRADRVAEGFDTVLSGGFDAVYVGALPAPLWQRALRRLNDAGIGVLTGAVSDVDLTEVDAASVGPLSSVRGAELLAAYVVAEGDPSNVVFYETPELTFTTVMREAFVAKLSELCNDCTVRFAEIPVATLGTTAAGVVVNDLQAHPDTVTAVFAVGEQAAGLDSAMEVAGLETNNFCYAPDPAGLLQIREGFMQACLGFDYLAMAWTSVDTLARITIGQDLEPAEINDEQVVQFLTARDLEGVDVSFGWVGYPDYAERFSAAWNIAQ